MDWYTFVSLGTGIVTAIIAIIALFYTHKQIQISNKQHLFDKRIENYIIATGLIDLYERNSIHFDYEKNEPFFNNDLYFSMLTNNTYLEQISFAIKNPLTMPYQKELLIKLESIKDVATKIKFLFTSNDSILLGDFVIAYQELLFTMYQYQIVIDKMMNNPEKISIEEAIEKFGEKNIRVKLQTAFANLKEVDVKLRKENVKEKIKKQIKLL